MYGRDKDSKHNCDDGGDDEHGHQWRPVIVMAYIVMAYISMAYIVMADIVMACIVMAATMSKVVSGSLPLCICLST